MVCIKCYDGNSGQSTQLSWIAFHHVFAAKSATIIAYIITSLSAY